MYCTIYIIKERYRSTKAHIDNFYINKHKYFKEFVKYSKIYNIFTQKIYDMLVYINKWAYIGKKEVNYYVIELQPAIYIPVYSCSIRYLDRLNCYKRKLPKK